MVITVFQPDFSITTATPPFQNYPHSPKVRVCSLPSLTLNIRARFSRFVPWKCLCLVAPLVFLPLD